MELEVAAASRETLGRVMSKKNECCEKYKKGKPCKDCPYLTSLPKKKRKKILKKREKQG